MEIVNTFYLCAIQGNTNLLKDLHKYHSIDVNISDKDGTTPLILASANNQLEVVIELLKMGADPNKVRNSGTGPLFFACQAGYTKVAEVLINKGAAVNHQNRHDRGTPLLVASQNGHTNCVSLLLARGAKVDQQLKDGATALFLAAQGGHLNTTEVLIKFGANVNLPKRDLTTPLYIASQMGHYRVVKGLLESGAEVDAAREDGSTSLFKATQKGHRLVIEALLKRGACLGLLGNGETALHMAVLFGRTRISHLLLVNGADPLMKNKEGMSSSDVAKEAQYNDLVTVLESFEERNSLVNISSNHKVKLSPLVIPNGHCFNNIPPNGCTNNIPMKHHFGLSSRNVRRPHDPYTAPSSLASSDLHEHDHHHHRTINESSCNRSKSSSDSSGTTSNYSTTNSDQTTGTIHVIPHLSAPTPLFHHFPSSKLFNTFMPPSNTAQLIQAIQSMAKPSVVRNDSLLPLPRTDLGSVKSRNDMEFLSPDIFVSSHSNRVSSSSDEKTLQKTGTDDEEVDDDQSEYNENENAISILEEIQPPSHNEVLSKLLLQDNELLNIEKLLATRHSNPEIREIEELRKVFACCTATSNTTQHKTDDTTNQHLADSPELTTKQREVLENNSESIIVPSPPIVVGSFHKQPIKINPTNSSSNHNRLTSSSYMKSPPPPYRGPQNYYHNHYHRLYHHHHHHYPSYNHPPPLPIPPHMMTLNSVNTTTATTTINNNNNTSTSSIYSSNFDLNIDPSTIVVGRRKLSQPNLKTYNLYDK